MSDNVAGGNQKLKLAFQETVPAETTSAKVIVVSAADGCGKSLSSEIEIATVLGFRQTEDR